MAIGPICDWFARCLSIGSARNDASGRIEEPPRPSESCGAKKNSMRPTRALPHSSTRPKRAGAPDRTLPAPRYGGPRSGHTAAPV